MKIEESFVVRAPIDAVWRAITDPNVVGLCIPGCEEVEVIDGHTYRGRVRVALGPIKTRFNVVVEVTEEEEPSHVLSVTRGEEGGRASTLSAENMLRLHDLGSDGTEVFYSSDISLVGRLGNFGLGVMKKRAKILADQFATAFRERLETPGT